MRRTQHTTQVRGPVPGHNDASHKKRLGLLAIIVTVVAGLAAAGLFMVTRSDTAEAPAYVFTDVPADQPVFEARGARGNDPFFPVEAQVLSFRNKVETQSGESMSDLDILALDESIKTGLFGGTEENTCDPERLISFLYANPDLGEVWAGVHNIEFNEIADYVRSLEIRVLAEPTNVLNHGFDPATGGAYEIDTILDAGTAVLVDAEGAVRTRCYCGNPIKPKPPQHRPPRCIVFGALVFTVPGGTDQISDAPTNVVLTGQQANGALGNWIEVSWGTDAGQTGWTQSINLNKYHCAPPRDTGLCPGPGAVGVYAGPDTTSQVGELNGTINQATGAIDVQSPISRVGGPNGVVVENGFVLIRFTQPAPSIQNSGWVQIAQLNDTDCMPVAQCVNTESAAKARAGGIDIRPAGIYKVEFTGRFTTDRSATEVRFLDGGEVGWITNFYTPLPWADCEDDPAIEPVVKCVGNQRDLEYVWNTATSVDPTQRVGQVKNTPVTLIGDLTPTNGRVEIQMGPGGPIGWIDATKLDGNNRYCFPREVCIETGGPAWSIYKTEGVQMANTPGGPALTKAWAAYAIDDAGAAQPEFHFLIQRDGQTGWLDRTDIIVPADRTCGEEPAVKPKCAVASAGIDDALAEAKAGGSTGTAELEAAGVDSQELRATALRSANGACCLTKAVFDSDAANNEQAVAEPVAVVLSGTTNDAGTWYEIATVYPGKWAPAVNFVDPATCTGDPTPDGCGGFVPGTTFVPEDACCIGSKVIGESGQSEGIDPPQFAEFVGTVNDHGDFIYEMRLLPEGRTVFAAPDNLAPIGLCTGNPPTGIACPVINSQDSQVGGTFPINGRCCADLPGSGLTVVNLEGTVDTGGGDDPLGFEYLTINNGWMPGEVFVSGATCDANANISCPELSNQEPTVGPADALTCCADIGGGTFSVVTLEGTIDFQDLDPFNWEYLTIDDGWIKAEDFWDSTNCVVTQASAPSNPAEPSAPAAVTEPASPAPQVPAPDPAPSSGCIADRDGDGVCDNDDNCPDSRNADQANSNRDLRGDACDPVQACTQNSDGTGDRDNDGVCNQDDNCASVPNPNQENTFGGFQGDACEDPDACVGGGTDKDGDKVCDKDDNCPGTPNPDQKNGYGDSRGDACEEPCPNNRVNGTECCKEGTFASKDDCYQPCPNGQDLDYERNGCQTTCPDGSVVPQGKDCPPVCPIARQNPDTGGCCKEGTEYYHGACYVICKDGNPDLGDGCGPCRARGGDRDGDGICDRDDNCPDVRTTKQTDSDGDGIGDACDKD